MKTFTNRSGNKSSKSFLKGSIIAGIIILGLQQAVGQQKWRVELRPAVNFATKDLGAVSLKTGVGIEGQVSRRVMQHLELYAGWGWNHFTANLSQEESENEFEETGYSFGLQFMHPAGRSKINYMIRAGAIYNHIETENTEGDIINNTGHGFGWQAGAGMAFPVSKRMLIIPELRYRSLSRDMKNGNASTPVDLNYLSAGLAVSWSF